MRCSVRGEAGFGEGSGGSKWRRWYVGIWFILILDGFSHVKLRY